MRRSPAGISKKLSQIVSEVLTQIQFDKIAERLLASGFKPASTTTEFQEFTIISEDPSEKYYSAEEMVIQLVEDFWTNREFTVRAMRLAQEEADDALEDLLIS